MKSLSAPTRFAIQSNVDFRVYKVYLNATWSPSPSLKLQHRQTTENRSSVSINDTKRGRDFQHNFLLRHTTSHIFWYKQPVWQISLCMCVCVCVCVLGWRYTCFLTTRWCRKPAVLWTQLFTYLSMYFVCYQRIPLKGTPESSDRIELPDLHDVNDKHGNSWGGYYFVNFEITAEKATVAPSYMVFKCP